MKLPSKTVVNPNAGETTTVPDLGDKPVGLARFFSRNAPWLILRRKMNVEPFPQADVESLGSIDSE
jgi:hypothetical protein